MVTQIVDFRFYFLPFCPHCIFWIDKKYFFTPTLNLCTSLYVSFWLKYCSPDVCQPVMLAVDIWLFCLYVCRLLSLFLLSVLCICEVISFPLFCCMLIYVRLSCFCDSHLIWVDVAVKPTNTSECAQLVFFPPLIKKRGKRQKGNISLSYLESVVSSSFLDTLNDHCYTSHKKSHMS